MTDGPVRQQIIDKLTQAFEPASLEVIDESHLHAGHSGAREGGESHFRVKIAADAFAGKMLVQRHRLVNEALADELAGPVHALAIKARAPDE
ncbi:MAG: BolA family protein [Hyphomicrobiales bacterium]